MLIVVDALDALSAIVELDRDHGPVLSISINLIVSSLAKLILILYGKV